MAGTKELVEFKKSNRISSKSIKIHIKIFRNIFCKIYPKDPKEIEEESKLIFNKVSDPIMITNIEPTKTANAEILCNRDDLDDLLMDQEKESENTYGKIILREYMRLLNSENAKINFILKILSKAVNEHKIFVIYGIFPPIRKPLGQRGWIEKKFIRKMLSMSPEISEGYSQKLIPFFDKRENIYILHISAGLETVEKLLKCPPNFIWYSNKRASIRTEERTIVNKFTGCYFTSKVVYAKFPLFFPSFF